MHLSIISSLILNAGGSHIDMVYVYVTAFSSEMKDPKLHKLGVFWVNYDKKHPIWAKLFCFVLFCFSFFEKNGNGMEKVTFSRSGRHIHVQFWRKYPHRDLMVNRSPCGPSSKIQNIIPGISWLSQAFTSLPIRILWQVFDKIASRVAWQLRWGPYGHHVDHRKTLEKKKKKKKKLLHTRDLRPFIKSIKFNMMNVW